jgi:hypothetical protein
MDAVVMHVLLTCQKSSTAASVKISSRCMMHCHFFLSSFPVVS